MGKIDFKLSHYPEIEIGLEVSWAAIATEDRSMKRIHVAI